MQISIFSYMEVVKKRLIDIIPMKIEYELKYKLKLNIQQILQEVILPKLDVLMGEPYEITLKRKELKESINSLEKAFQVLQKL